MYTGREPMRTASTSWRSAWTTLFGTPPPAQLPAVDAETVKRAFRKRVRETHPDLRSSTDPDAGRAFREVTQAYEELTRCLATRGEEGRRRRPPVTRGTIRVTQPTAAARSTSLPRRRLALAQLLVHLGWVSWDAALEALRWQEAKRLPLGELAAELGRLRQTDVARILRLKRPAEPFGACATRLGLLSSDAVRVLLERQRRLLPPVGQFFVREGLLTPERLHRALDRQREHNAAFDRLRDVRAA